MSVNVPRSTSGCRTTSSASPVSTAEKLPRRTSSTTLDSLADASSTGPLGETTASEIPPTVRLSPAATSRTPWPPQSFWAVDSAGESSSKAPAGNATNPTSINPSSASSPPAWSACRCVMTTPSSVRTPARASADLSTAGDGPVSTSIAWVPSRSRIASPCVTSSTSSVGPEMGRGPMASSSVATTITAIKPRELPRDGVGQTAHTRPRAPIATAEPISAGNASGTDAWGHEASHDATETAHAPMAPAKSRTAVPIPGAIAETERPSRPARSTTETSGPTARFAIGETSDTIWKTGTVIGSVLTVAARVRETGSARPFSMRGTAGSIHAVPRRASRTSPATAATDRRNPRSNALAGDSATTTVTATASVDPPSVRRPETHAAEAAIAMTHARTADGWTPENAT